MSTTTGGGAHPAAASPPAAPTPARRQPFVWNFLGRGRDEIDLGSDWPREVTPEWAWGGATGRGVRVCVLDSGIEPDHPRIGRVDGAWATRREADGGFAIEPNEDGDRCGHGTACASILRGLAPECELYDVCVLSADFQGTGDALIAGLRWAVRQGYDVINMSLSTTRRTFAEALHQIADEAYFNRTLLVASAHNMPVESFPWRFSSVISVGSHEEEDPHTVLYNPNPPVEFFARGVNVSVGWSGGGTSVCTGNSFANAHVAALCALILSKHRDLTPFQVKSVLHLTASNVRRTSR